MKMALTLSPELAFLIAVVAFWAILYFLNFAFHLKKHGFEVTPIYFMYRSKALNGLIDSIAKKKPRLWAILSNIGLALSIGLMIFSIYFLAGNLFRLLFHTSQATSIVPAIPVLTIRFYWLPYFFLAVVITAATHELAHGIIARLERIPILSAGILGFLVFFGAFVEPDEKEFEKASLMSRLRMLGAGSSVNLMTGLIMLLLVTILFTAPAGVLIQEVVPQSPMANAGLRQWDVINAVNGTQVVSPVEFSNVLVNVTPGEQLVLTVLHDNRLENISVTTIESPPNSSHGIIGILPGISYRPFVFGLDQYTGVHLYLALFWIYLIGISLAIFNMFPAYPFDGEKVLYYPLVNLVGRRKKELRQALNIVSWGLFASNMIISVWLMGLSSI
jgi:membrane-associated protease RseP (regulator of RpoE activity)